MTQEQLELEFYSLLEHLKEVIVQLGWETTLN